MSRNFQDENLLEWEAYASGGAHGYADNARIVFHCLSDSSLRARELTLEGDQADAERVVTSRDDEQLRTLLEQATEVR